MPDWYVARQASCHIRNPHYKKLRQADWAWGSKKPAHGPEGGGVVPPLYASYAAPLGPAAPGLVSWLCAVRFSHQQRCAQVQAQSTLHRSYSLHLPGLGLCQYHCSRHTTLWKPWWKRDPVCAVRCAGAGSARRLRAGGCGASQRA